MWHLIGHIGSAKSLLDDVPSDFQIDVGTSSLVQSFKPKAEVLKSMLGLVTAFEMREEELSPWPHSFGQMRSETLKCVINIEKSRPQQLISPLKLFDISL